ncbi:MAG TPA: class II aldolase/adducin family protein [Smithella sp.]|nr:class II aldolase/adducin family protein [Smithella sp.]MDM7988730.1 class II aldolase/adducin family protein [Smithella sp.]HNY49324.1 class II aldolase/adducin family protein [Smithella sp.]HOG89929.1 class II aldolase/adducin family protein [Smithella sp.]HQG66301.1 class II aldolase/adducin family protein [Smithella sp.]
MSEYRKYKQDVLDATQWLYQEGYFGSQRGSGGNVSVRVRETVMAITPSSVKYPELVVEDICIVDLDLSVIEENQKLKPSVESAMHSIIYRNRPDVNAIVHTHQPYGSVFSLINTSIPALFDEVAFSLGQTIDVVPYALSGSSELVHNVAAKLSNNANAYILQNHGILALGRDLDKAILHAELLEKVAHIYCFALSTGKPVTALPESIIAVVKLVRDGEVEQAAKKKQDN